jgi:hypothetical protein
MANKGKVVSAIPAPTRVSKSRIDWDTPARLAKMSGQPVLAGEHIRNTLVKSLRQYDRPPFKTDEGHIAVILRNSSIEDDGQRYGDVYMQWVPNDKKED